MKFRFAFPLMLVGTFLLLALAEAATAARKDDLTWAVSAGFTGVFVLVVGYAMLSRWIERRRAVPEISAGNAARWLLPGMLLGSMAYGLVINGIRLLGGWDAQTGGTLAGLAITSGIMACVATAEEVVFRGVLTRMLTDRFGGWVALIVSSVLFGAMHVDNAHATLPAVASIVLTGGLLFGVLFLLTRSLWLTIGFHFAWNTVQGGVYGVASSGEDLDHSLFHVTLSGPDWLTGGAFGPEASVLTLVVITVPALVLLVVAARTGKLGRPARVPAEAGTSSRADESPSVGASSSVE